VNRKSFSAGMRGGELQVGTGKKFAVFKPVGENEGIKEIFPKGGHRKK